MNTKQKIQVGLGVLLVLGGAVSCFIFPPAAAPLMTGGVAVAGFSDTISKAIVNAITK